jgi:hypothetical protein
MGKILIQDSVDKADCRLAIPFLMALSETLEN